MVGASRRCAVCRITCCREQALQCLSGRTLEAAQATLQGGGGCSSGSNVRRMQVSPVDVEACNTAALLVSASNKVCCRGGSRDVILNCAARWPLRARVQLDKAHLVTWLGFGGVYCRPGFLVAPEPAQTEYFLVCPVWLPLPSVSLHGHRQELQSCQPCNSHT